MNKLKYTSELQVISVRFNLKNFPSLSSIVSEWMSHCDGHLKRSQTLTCAEVFLLNLRGGKWRKEEMSLLDLYFYVLMKWLSPFEVCIDFSCKQLKEVV